MSLFEQHPWIIMLSALSFGFFMVHAMMEFTASLLVKPPPANRKPVGAIELRWRLLQLNENNHPYKLIESHDSDLELHWDVVKASWQARFAKVKLTTLYRARILLDESRHELRFHEYLRTASFFLGFAGWQPHFNAYIGFQAGYVSGTWAGRAYGLLPGFPPRIGQVYNFQVSTDEAKADITGVANDSGWTFRPVLWWFQATHRGYRLLQALTLAPFRHVPARRFWGIIYPVSYSSLSAI